MSVLAIDGGKKIFSDGVNFDPWPPVYEETGDKIRELYMSHKWSYYGPVEKQFCENFAAYHDSQYGIFMANGTVTLECALAALGIGPGDEVIVPSWTWMATGMAAIYLGATPVFVDGEADTFCMDPAAFEAAITPKTKAVIPVHLFGSMADMDKIMEIARKHNIKVVEDCAHAHGGKWNGKGLGSFGDVGSFSFQQSKIMTSGEAGICTTDDDHLCEYMNRLKHIGNPGVQRNAPTTPPPTNLICHNYRATEFQALILQGQLERLDADSKIRSENADFLRTELEKIPGIGTQKPGRCATVQNYYVFGATVDPSVLKEGKTRNDILAAVQAEGIPADLVFAGWGQPTFKQRLWNISPEKFRVESSEVVEDIIYNRIMLMDIRWLHADRSTLTKLIEAFAKVMKEYSK